MKKTAVFWFIEHIARELDVAAACAALLERDGVEVTIMPIAYPTVPSNAFPDRPDIVLLPYCYSLSDPHLGFILRHWPEAAYINLSWEQIFYRANLEYKAPQDTFATRYVYHHVWSRDRKRFLEKRGVPADHIFVNGHPAYALYDMPYRSVFPARVELATEFGLDGQKRWIFFPENYSWFFYSDHNLAEIIRKGQSRETVQKMRDYCGTCFTTVLQWLAEASRSVPSAEIILRPRPTFTLSHFRKKMQDVLPTIPKHLHVIKDYSVREWILAADAVISSFSTSLIEAAVAKKPLAMLEPYPLPASLTADWYAMVPKIRSKQEVFRFCAAGPKEKDSRLSAWARREMLSTGDPIRNLVQYLTRFPAKTAQRELADLRKTLPDFNAQSRSGGLAVRKVLGRIKQLATGELSYYDNDDRRRYRREISRKVDQYRQFFASRSTPSASR